MTDEQTPALEAGDEVVQSEVEENTEAPEAVDSTEGQDDSQPAEDDGNEPEAEEKKSASQIRRERRKAHMAELRAKAEAAEAKERDAQQRLARIKESAQSNLPPKEADFQDYQEFLVASSAWHAGREFDKRTAAEIQREAEAQRGEIETLTKQQQAEARENWAAQRAEAKERYADFDAVVTAPDVAFSEQMVEFITNSDVGADVAYHLGTHKAEAARIARLNPYQQAMEFGRLEERVKLPKPRTKSNAPEPIKTVRPKATAAKDVESMTMEEYSAARRQGKL
jgi:hypothetical protein